MTRLRHAIALPEYQAILTNFTSVCPRDYIAVIHRRIPFTDGTPLEPTIVKQRIPELTTAESRLLLQQLLNRHNISASIEDIDELVEYIGGYPPSAQFTVNAIQQYGLPVLIADKHLLVDFKARRFTRFVAELKLDDAGWKILTYIASEDPLSIACISAALGITHEVCSEVLQQLLDHSLASHMDGKYFAQSPVRDAVVRVRGIPTAAEYDTIANNLIRVFWNNTNQQPPIDVVDATLRSISRSGSTQFGPYSPFVRASTLHNFAQQAYRVQNFKLAAEYARRAQELPNCRRGALQIELKSYIQLELWTEAERVLIAVKERGDREGRYLEGFLLKRRRQYKKACVAFEAGLLAGDDSFPLHRDYADCLYRVGHFEKAASEIELVLSRSSDNVFVLDLLARVLIDDHKLEKAEKVVDDLERCDVKEEFIHHRRSRLRLAQGRTAEALEEADKAIQFGSAVFEAHAQRANILIRTGDRAGAEHALRQMREKFGTRKQDVQLGLAVKLNLLKHEWRRAYELWKQVEAKQEPVHRALEAQILDAKARDVAVPLTEREQATTHAKSVRDSLGRIPIEAFLVEPDDIDTSEKDM